MCQTWSERDFLALLFMEDGVRKLGAWMLCFIAVTWLSVGGCQRPVVHSPEPVWNRSQRPLVPEPAEIVPPIVAMPQIPFGNPWKPSVAARDWKHIVIHHTASEGGSVATIHAEHLNRKDKNGNNWKGIGYHFLIGNGTGMGDGEIEPTFRWKKQMQGAHAGNDEYNQHGIGICLVGNFQDHRPSSAQLVSIKRLVGVLKREYGLKSSQVVGHRDVKATACPGKLFPLTEIALSEDAPFFSSRDGVPSPSFVTAAGGTSE
ncbi:MAG: N-acetylmuramoyl-L-alanine amidase [Planctomycetaceae bacterium]|nr:N-acetylmuramoyl-L-alanine amidase [Planctomycetaceae bacterium]